MSITTTDGRQFVATAGNGTYLTCADLATISADAQAAGVPPGTPAQVSPNGITVTFNWTP